MFESDGGFHTRLDHQAGLLLGARIGQYTLRRALDRTEHVLAIRA